MLREGIAIAAATCFFCGPQTSLMGEPMASTGPNLRLLLAPKQLTSQTSFALMGELGEKTARLNATIGYQIGVDQRLKLSVDQLCQKLTYNYMNGTASAWVQQIAGGASYKCYLDDQVFDSIDAGGWYSNAPMRRLQPVVFADGSTTRSFARRVSSSEAWHGYLGTTIFPWRCATLGVAVVYDHVDYRRRILDNKYVSGAGVAIDFSQRITKGLDLNLKADVTAPYQHVGGLVNWTTSSAYGDIALGLYGDYTQGRKGLPSDASFGVQLNLSFGSGCFVAPFYKNYCVRDKSRPRQDLLEWIADPAVMMPIVLAIADESTPPGAIALPDVFIDDFGPYTIDVSGAFTPGGWSAVRYSAKGLPPNAHINEFTGVISGINLGVFTTPYFVKIEAKNLCGAATSTFTLTLENL